jgi:hypothetical protein
MSCKQKKSCRNTRREKPIRSINKSYYSTAKYGLRSMRSMRSMRGGFIWGTRCLIKVSQCHCHGHGHGHGISILATHPEGIWTANPPSRALRGPPRRKVAAVNIKGTYHQDAALCFVNCHWYDFAFTKKTFSIRSRAAVLPERCLICGTAWPERCLICGTAWPERCLICGTAWPEMCLICGRAWSEMCLICGRAWPERCQICSRALI